MRSPTMPRISLGSTKIIRNFDNQTTNSFPNGCIRNGGTISWSIDASVFFAGAKSLKAGNGGISVSHQWLLDDQKYQPSGDYTITCAVRMSKVDNSSTGRIGLMVRCTRTTGYGIMFRPAGSNSIGLRLSKFTNNSETPISTTGTVLTGVADTWYYLKVSLNGTAIKAKCWLPTATEPDWQLSTTDSTYDNTYQGIGYYTSLGTTDNVTGYIDEVVADGGLTRTAVT